MLGERPGRSAPMLPCAHAPKADELHRIAGALQAVQRKNFFQIHASIRRRGRYHHEYTMAIQVERDSPTWQPPTDDAEDTVTDAMRDLARWLYCLLAISCSLRTTRCARVEGFSWRIGCPSLDASSKALSARVQAWSRIGLISS